MKKIIIILIFLILIPCSLSTSLGDQVNKELKQVSITLNSSTINETVINTFNFINEKINYKFYWYARGNNLAWYQKEGDCTDKTALITTLLNMNNITTRKVFGMTKSLDNEWSLHAWFEYYNKDQWINIENEYHKRMIVYHYY